MVSPSTSPTVVWDLRRRALTRAAMDSSMYLGVLRMGLVLSTIFFAMVWVLGDATINREGGSYSVGGDSSKRTLGTGWVS